MRNPPIRTIDDVLANATKIYYNGQSVKGRRAYSKRDKKALVKLVFELRRLGGTVSVLRTLGFTTCLYRWIEKYGTKAQKLEIFGTTAKPAWMKHSKAPKQDDQLNVKIDYPSGLHQLGGPAIPSDEGDPQTPYIAEPCEPATKPGIFRRLWNFITG